MRVKIKKEGKLKTYKLIESWSDVTLEKWLQILKLENSNNSTEAIETIVALSNIPKDLIAKIPLSDVCVIMSKITELQKDINNKLEKTFTIDEVEYGMHPNMDVLTLGEYADIENLIKLGIEKHLPELMAILFRPVVARKNDAYTIEAYDGEIDIRAEIMKSMSAEQVQNALVFFWHFGKSVLIALQLFSAEILNQKKEK